MTAIAAFGLLSCSPPAPLDIDISAPNCRWTQSGGGPQRTAFAEGVPGLPQFEWKRKLGGALFLEPTVSEGVVLVPAADKVIYLVAARNGDLLTSLKVGGSITASCPAVDSLVVVNADGAELSILNWQTGRIVWKVEIGGQESEPAILGDKIFWVGGRETLNCFNLSEGKHIWDRRLSRKIAVSPSACSSGVFIVDDTNYIRCFDVQDGRQLWEFPAPSRIRNAPLIWGDFLIFCTTDGVVGKLMLQDGTLVWQKNLDFRIWAPVACDGQGIFIGTNERRIIKLDFENGEKIWDQEIDGPVKAGVCLAGNISVFASLNHSIYFVDKNSGAIMSRYETDGMVSTRPSACDDRIFVAGEDRNLYCFRIAGEK